MKRILKDVKENKKGFICIYEDGFNEQFVNVDIQPYLDELKEIKSHKNDSENEKVELKRVTLRLPQSIYLKFRMKCLESNISMNDYMLQLINSDLEINNK